MDELVRLAIKCKSQQEDHEAHGEMHEFGPSMADELMRLYNLAIKLGSEGVKIDVAA